MKNSPTVRIFSVLTFIIIILPGCKSNIDPTCLKSSRVLQYQGSGVVSSLSLSADSKVLVSGTSAYNAEDQIMTAWDISSGKQLFNSNAKGGVESISLSPEGKYFAVAIGYNRLSILDTSSGKEIKRLLDGNNKSRSLCFSPDGKTLVSGHYDGSITIWDSSSWKEVEKINAHYDWGRRGKEVNDLEFSNDGKLLASASSDGTVILWKAGTWEMFHKLKGHDWSVLAVAFSPDGKIIASCGEERYIKNNPSIIIWDVLTGKEIKTLEAHDDYAYSLSFSPDGRYMASVGADETIMIWDTATWQVVRKLQGYKSKVVLYSKNADCLVSGGGGNKEGQITLWACR